MSLTCTTYRIAAKHLLRVGTKWPASKLFGAGRLYLFFSFIVLFVACSPNKKMSTTPTTMFDKQGHRGCRGNMPENTIPAMLHALAAGVTTLEMDVLFTKDSVAILSHEPFFNHEITTINPGTPTAAYITQNEEKNLNIYQMTYAQTQQYDVGLKPHPRFVQQQKMAVTKPSLAAVFDSVAAYLNTNPRPHPYFNIETKTTPATDHLYHPPPAAFIQMLVKLIQEKNMERWVTIQSFDVRTLQYLHQHYPQIPAVLLVEDADRKGLDAQIKTLGFTPAVYSPHYSLVTAALVAQCHARQLKIIPWTVNDSASITRLKQLGVDGIITDYPTLLNH
ncbi:MAG: hypothetical protein RL172_2934 [Bacteroidota bacterium]